MPARKEFRVSASGASMDVWHQQTSQAHPERLVLESLVVLANGRLGLLAVPVAVKGGRLVLELLPGSSLINKRISVAAQHQ